MTLTLHALPISGNCHKVRLLLSMLGLDYTEVTVDTVNKTPAFLALNPLGHVPVLEDGDIVIRDSQAILVYLARKFCGEGWYPTDPEQAGRVQQWLSFAANEMWHGPSKARAVFRFDRDWDLAQVQGESHRVLRILDDHLAGRDWLECGRPTIADLAVFPYTGLVHEGKVDVAGYPRVVAWLARVKALPGYVAIEGLE